MIDRIGCFSYVPLGYGTPQIQYLLESLVQHYDLKQPPGIIAPRWSTYRDLDEEFPQFFFHRLPPVSFNQPNLQSYVESVIEYCCQNNLRRVGFYGAGSHTRDLLKLWQDLSGPQVQLLLVTRAYSERQLLGLPIVAVDELGTDSLDIVILSSGTFESEMAESLTACHPTLPFIAIYNRALSRNVGFPPPKQVPLLDLDLYASWLDAYAPDLIICTHYTYLDALNRIRHKPKCILYYCFEVPGGTDGSQFTQEDVYVHRHVKGKISLALFPELHRMHRYQSTFDFEAVPSAVVFNSRPAALVNPHPWDRRNGRVLLQGSLVEGRSFTEYLPRRRGSQMAIDVFGPASHPATVAVLNDPELSRIGRYRFCGHLSNRELSALRSKYAFSLVMWNPITFDALHACPNKFFESIADGVPPISAPHPQCAEIIERFNCGILLKDWSLGSYCEGLHEAESIFGTHRYQQLVENCARAQRELCWERQFENIKPLLPAKPKVKKPNRPRFILIDPSLESEVGHHLTYAENVLQPARQAGYETVLGLNRNFLVNVRGADRLYPVCWYDFWGRDTSMPERPVMPHAPERFIRSVELLLSGEKVSGQDHVFVPNISDIDLNALVEVLPLQNLARETTWHFVLRHDLPADPRLRLSALQRILKRLGKKVRFYTDTSELAQQHELASGVPFHILPIPVTPDHSNSRSVPPAFCPPLRVSYVGDARSEKGFSELPTLVESCLDMLKEGMMRFSIQCNTSGPDFQCGLAIKRLKRLARTYPVDLVTTRLSKEAYEASIRNSDVILALYDRVSYLRRSSHVVMEALIYGKAVVVTKGTAPAGYLPTECPWLCEQPTAAEEPLRWIVNNLGETSKIAASIQAEHAAFHTGARLIESILSGARNTRVDSFGN